MTYSIVQKTNNDIQKYAGVFLGSTVDSVFHTGGEIPTGTKKLLNPPSIFNFFSINKPVLISYIKNNSKKYIAFLNKDLKDSANLIIEPKVRYYYIDKNGKEVLGSSGRKTFNILPGDILVLRYK